MKKTAIDGGAAANQQIQRKDTTTRAREEGARELEVREEKVPGEGLVMHSGQEAETSNAVVRAAKKVVKAIAAVPAIVAGTVTGIIRHGTPTQKALLAGELVVALAVIGAEAVFAPEALPITLKVMSGLAVGQGVGNAVGYDTAQQTSQGLFDLAAGMSKVSNAMADGTQDKIEIVDDPSAKKAGV
jgi:hypothetical protein